jgi:hypothetical protein
LKYYYKLPDFLEDKGYNYVFKRLQFNGDNEPFLEDPFGDIVKVDVFDKRQVENS